MVAKKRQSSIESGFASEDSENIDSSSSATRNFFKTYMPQLEMAVRQFEDFDDPTIELDQIAIRTSHNIRHPHQDAQRETPSKRKDPTLEELEFMVGEFKKQNQYSRKLTDIMLKGLEKTLAKEVYQLFLRNRIPDNWIPIVKMNNDNTPYVEFLIKADAADQDPVSQLNDYSTEHMAYSKFLVDSLCQTTNRMRTPQPSQKKIHHIPQPNTSTPISQRKKANPPSSHSSTVAESIDLNDSKRILPSRACKTSFSGVYR